MADKLDAILKSYVAEGTTTKDKLLGASFVVFNKDGPLYQGSAGRTRAPPSSPPFTPPSITWLASMTKLLTTTCLLHFTTHNPHLLTLDQDLRPLIPELASNPILTGFVSAADAADAAASTSSGSGEGKAKKEGEPILIPNTSPLTLRHLLTHTSGFGVDVADPDLMRWSKWLGRTSHTGSCTVDGWLTPLKFAPGEGWYYGVGIDWAGVVLLRVSGRQVGEYFEEFIAGPLRLDSIGWRVGKVLGEEGKDGGEWVPRAERDEETGEIKEGGVEFPEVPEVESGGAGGYGSALGFGRVLQVLLRGLAGEEENEGVVLNQETVREMLRPQLTEVQKQWMRAIVWTYKSASEIPEGSAVDYGMGGLINMEDVEGRRRKGSIMWSGFCNSRWWLDPETGIGAALIVQLTPYGDETVFKMYDELERAVYAELVPQK
ncbi:beta-lactamase/transpeptidase-like protein [Dichotomopilus funicola]|uniref:Beta-lactamase/transpeptidase-like protein n=1 Tax=Dichotomopilus funicola TaxID=1934379 RepID=A0AAN6UXT3_9PEZI|nr:beta-lactamase/transpeptidase-like protein [Dichotomopilus funicola]